MLRNYLLNLPRRYKRILQVAVDLLLIIFALWLAFVMRVGFDDAFVRLKTHSRLLWAAPLISLPLFIRFGMYRAVLRYLGQEALLQIFRAVTGAALLLALAVYWYQTPGAPAVPRSFVLNYWVISLALVGGLRLLMRQYFLGDWLAASQAIIPFWKQSKELPRVAIYGAGSAGNQ
ncbi:MAG TPA: polysaccharide biosynthesis protein, partial [Thiopseudomonas sp.]|nr:polysaccharide biosynthesis protein [Thiopseudomonas sp.]